MEKIRYRVRGCFADEPTTQRFLKWMQQEHGAELLAVAGCLEYRVYLTDSNQLDCEYLFESRSALDTYLKEQAPKLREKGRSLFNEDQASFSRDVSPLLDFGQK